MAFSLFGHDKSNQQNNESIKQKVVMVPVDAIVPNRFQPRHVFNKRSVDELAFYGHMNRISTRSLPVSGAFGQSKR